MLFKYLAKFILIQPDDDDDKELEETHTDQQVGEEVFLHRRVTCSIFTI